VTAPRRNRLALHIQTALVGSHLLVLLLPVAVLLTTDALPHDLVTQRQKEIAREAALVALLVQGELHDDGAGEVPTSTLTAAQAVTNAGIRVLDMHGKVTATTGPRLGEDLSERPEVIDALHGKPAVTARREGPPNATPKRPNPVAHPTRTWAFAATPLVVDGKQVGVVLLARTTREVKDFFEDLSADLGPGASAAAIATLTLALFAGWRISRSLRALSAIADRVAEGRGPGEELHAITDTRILEVRHLARAFEAMTARLQARLRYNREFASNVSHEFKTPLTTLRGTVDLLVEDDEMPPEQRALFLTNARTDLDRLHRLVGGLLELARAEEGTAHVTVNLDALLIQLAGRYPEVRFTGAAGVVRGDASQLELAIDNLVANALDHGGPNVSVTAWREGERAGVDVTDDGPGISEANLPKVFERFFTTGRDRQGTGLGLAIVSAVAKAHGGDVTVESAPGRTWFRFWVG
jgi:signal transduction histidine kinase